MLTEIRVKKGRIEEERAEAVVLTHFENETTLRDDEARMDHAVGGRIRKLIDSKEFTGKANQISILHVDGAVPAKRIVLAGLGKQRTATLESIRQATATASKTIRELGISSFSLSFPTQTVGGSSVDDIGQAIVEGCLLGLYRFLVYQTNQSNHRKSIRSVTLVCSDAKLIDRIRAGAERGRITSEATNFVRDLCNHPANVVTPTRLADEAKAIAKSNGVRCTILDRDKAKTLGMGAYLGVAQGSHEPPKFIILEYRGGEKSEKPVVVVGKSITFDTGGISLKPSENMERMKADMTGGAIVLGTFRALTQLNLPINVVGILPATENMPGGRATRPGDIVRSLSGKTIEVLNTDAEGRLALADGLAYAMRFKPAMVIDIATLTGAVFVALGNHAIGLLGNNEKLLDRIARVGESVGERVWQLPLWDEYKEQIKSDVADIKNIGGRGGGTITAAAFLSHFVEGCPWAHLDIAGIDWSESARAYIPKGPTGIGTRLMIQILRDYAQKS